MPVQWSNLAHTDDDFPAASAKHLTDARHLLDSRRFDNAGYLAGYVIECALKTLVITRHLAATCGLGPGANAYPPTELQQGHKQARKFSHDLEGLSKEALQLAALPRAATASYNIQDYAPQTLATSVYLLWSETIRYRPEGAVGATAARAWTDEAERVYRASIMRMRKDGILS